MPDTRGKDSKSYPILFQYYDSDLTTALSQWNDAIAVIEKHDLRTTIAFLLANRLTTSPADREWYFVVYKGRQPGVYTQQ